MTLEQRLGYTFSDPALLELALTHRSVSSDDLDRYDNERLEFLGDAVLQLAITETLYRDYPQLAEGQLAKVRAGLVSRSALAEVSRSLDIGRYVELAPGEERSGGREKDSIVADALEAIIGAVYLDSGLEAAARIIDSLWGDRVAERARRPGVRDYKTRLQEVLAQTGQRPEYQVEGSGPDHDRWFHAAVLVEGRQVGEGEGRSKKEAEQEAARAALGSLTQS